MGEDEARQDEEEFHPQIAARRQKIERPEIAVVMALAEMEHHHHQRRKGPRAGQGANFRSGVCSSRRRVPCRESSARDAPLSCARIQIAWALGGRDRMAENLLVASAIGPGDRRRSSRWPGRCRRTGAPFRFRMVAAALAAADGDRAAAAEIAARPRCAVLGLNAVVTALSHGHHGGHQLSSSAMWRRRRRPSPSPIPRNLTSLAFGVLPLVIVISALSALLWYWRILPLIVGGMAFVLRRDLGPGRRDGAGLGRHRLFGHYRGAAADPALSVS